MKNEESFSPFYNSFLSLCKRDGLTPTAAARNAGIASGAPTAWKKGSVPKPEQRKRLCDLFDVSEDILLGYKKEGLADNIGELSEEEIEYIRWFREEASEKEKALVRTLIKGEEK